MQRMVVLLSVLATSADKEDRRNLVVRSSVVYSRQKEAKQETSEHAPSCVGTKQTRATVYSHVHVLHTV